MGFFSRFAVVAVVGIAVLLAILYDMTRQKGSVKPQERPSSAIAQNQQGKSEERPSTAETTPNAAPLQQTKEQTTQNQTTAAATADTSINTQQNTSAPKDESTNPHEHKLAPQKHPAVPTCHTVKRGETLAGIARRYFGDWRLWRAIAYANNIKRVGDLRVGQEIAIPALKVHKVQAGETLYSICQNHRRENRLEIAVGELMRKVAVINSIEPSKLRAGQVIALPLR